MRETGRSDVGSGPWTKTSAFSPSHGSDKALEMGNVLRRGAGRVFGRSLATCGLTRGPAPLPFPTRPFPHLILSHTTPLPFPHLILSHTSIYLHQIPLTMEALSSSIPLSLSFHSSCSHESTTLLLLHRAPPPPPAASRGTGQPSGWQRKFLLIKLQPLAGFLLEPLVGDVTSREDFCSNYSLFLLEPILIFATILF